MNEGKKKDLKETISGLSVTTILDVGSEAAGDVAKESISSLVGDLLVDSIGSMIPGLYGAINGYKRARFERNINKFSEELLRNIDEIRKNLEQKSDEQRKKIDELFGFVMDKVVDEQQEDKIKFMVNGFVNITNHEKITDDFVLTYYDVLEELRLVDISVIKLMYSSHYLYDQAERETYNDVMDKHGITYEQYESVRRNLLRVGLLTTKTDIKITEDLEEIVKRIKDINTFLEKSTNPKNRSSLPKLKDLKLKSKDNFEISKFGRDFVEFFLGLN